MVDSVPLGDFTLLLSDEHGEVPPTRLLLSIRDHMQSSGRAVGRDIRPGTTATAELDLRLLFDLSLTGLYTVQAQRWVYIGRGQHMLESPTAHFEMFDQL